MDKNEIKKFNGVELEESYINTLDSLKTLKTKLLLLKSLSVSNVGLSTFAFSDAIYQMINNKRLDELLFLLAFGVVNVAILDHNYGSIKNVKIEIDDIDQNKQKIEKEIKVRNFIKNRKNMYHI